MILEETFTLASGVAIPEPGLGTWRIDKGPVAQIVRDAIDIGYRHIDTARAYRNEHVWQEAPGVLSRDLI